MTESKSGHANSCASFKEGLVYWFTSVQSRANKTQTIKDPDQKKST